MENRPTCTDDILKLPDMQSAMRLMKQWGIPTKGVSKREDAIGKLIDYWNAHEGKPRKTERGPTNGLSEAISADEKNRVKLSDKFDQVVNFYRKLPKQHKADLDEVFPNLEQKAKEKKEELKARECAILVAGETSAGKSSFINLLLGTSILPTCQLQCTATVVELRTSSEGRKSAILKYKPSDDRKRKQPKLLDLHKGEGLRELSSCITETDDYNGESPYERIEIFWPFPILQEGIVIVDTPGIGGGSQMSKVAERYLSKSFGFIYLVNSAAAGGIQKGRLKDFLRMVVNSADDDFSPMATMFICNKWETVPEGDKPEVRRNTLEKLTRVYPGVREDQIYYISVQQALSAAEYNTMTKEHEEVSQGIENLFPNSLRNKLNVHYRWLSQILKRSLYSLKVAKLMDAKGMETKQEMIEDLQRRMERLEVNSRLSVDELHKGVAFEVESLYKTVTKMLRDREFVQRLITWEDNDCPRPDDWKKTAREASERIGSRIALEVNLWERNNKVVSSIKDKIVKKFKRDFELMEDQIKAIEGALLEGETRVITDLHKSMKKQLPVKQLFKRAKGNDDEDSVKGLGGTVSSVGGFDVGDKNIKKLFSGYKKENRQQKMVEATDHFISHILSGQHLREKIEKFLGKYVKGIDNVAKMIPEFIKADRHLINTLQQQIKDSENKLKDVYPDLLHHCQLLQGQLDLFFVYRIIELDFRMRDLEWSKQDLLGTGSFAEVFKAKLHKDNQEITVAMKVCRDALKENTVSDILLEDRTLRELEHENIVKYYGSTCKQDGKGGSTRAYWIMVTEFCEGTLKELVINDNSYDDGGFLNPAKCGNSQTKLIKSMKKMAEIVIEICKGLSYLHSKDLVHRDLKCENVLVSHGVMKLTDFGLTKRIDYIGGSVVGSPVYMAPEVLLQQGLYGRKADIYSLAIILWEIWYGIDAADHIGRQLFGSLENAVKKGLRPSLTMSEKPPDDWARLIKQCWEYEPEKRPDIEFIISFFEKFVKEPRIDI